MIVAAAAEDSRAPWPLSAFGQHTHEMHPARAWRRVRAYDLQPMLNRARLRGVAAVVRHVEFEPGHLDMRVCCERLRALWLNQRLVS